MVSNQQKILDRIDRIGQYRNFLQTSGKISMEEFERNKERQYAVLHAMQNSIEACIEIASHIVSADRLGSPKDYAGFFSSLEQNDILSHDCAEQMRKMASFRNRIVHLYWDVDLNLVYSYLTQHLQDFDVYLESIQNYLRKDS